MSDAAQSETILAAMADLRRTLDAQRADLSRLENTLSQAVQLTLNAPCSGACGATLDLTMNSVAAEHRRNHRPGRLAKLDTDDALRAFVLARIDQQTFTEIADAVAAQFPEDRRASRTAIHHWWTKRRTKGEGK